VCTIWLGVEISAGLETCYFPHIAEPTKGIFFAGASGNMCTSNSTNFVVCQGLAKLQYTRKMGVFLFLHSCASNVFASSVTTFECVRHVGGNSLFVFLMRLCNTELVSVLVSFGVNQMSCTILCSDTLLPQTTSDNIFLAAIPGRVRIVFVLCWYCRSVWMLAFSLAMI
jgi:hypothetical protein